MPNVIYLRSLNFPNKLYKVFASLIYVKINYLCADTLRIRSATNLIISAVIPWVSSWVVTDYEGRYQSKGKEILKQTPF